MQRAVKRDEVDVQGSAGQMVRKSEIPFQSCEDPIFTLHLRNLQPCISFPLQLHLGDTWCSSWTMD